MPSHFYYRSFSPLIPEVWLKGVCAVSHHGDLSGQKAEMTTLRQGHTLDQGFGLHVLELVVEPDFIIRDFKFDKPTVG